jgi:hypothetical protein
MSDQDQSVGDVPKAGDVPVVLRWVVYIMGGLLVLMFLATMFGLAWKLKHRWTDLPPPPPPALNLNFSGEDVKHMALDGNRLAITAAHEIIVVDVTTGQALLRIPLK